MHRFLNRIFGKAEEINGANRCPTYLYRWVIAQKRGWFAAYIHHFVGSDWSLDFHDHPKRFISIGLWGSYVEHTPQSSRVYRAPWVRSFPAEYQHRIDCPSRNCWTITIVLKPVRAWGFWNDGVFIPFKEYVDSDLATARKNCP